MFKYYSANKNLFLSILKLISAYSYKLYIIFFLSWKTDTITVTTTTTQLNCEIN